MVRKPGAHAGIQTREPGIQGSAASQYATEKHKTIKDPFTIPLFKGFKDSFAFKFIIGLC